MALLLRRPRFNAVLVIAAILTLVMFYTIVSNHKTLQDTLSYATRPLWDKAETPAEVIPHFYGEGLEMNEQTCKLHGWKPREDKGNLKVLDAVLMSNELELLEIRMNELDAVVDYFLIVESNATFTGLAKETYFAKNRDRFAKFQHKIVYRL